MRQKILSIPKMIQELVLGGFKAPKNDDRKCPCITNTGAFTKLRRPSILAAFNPVQSRFLNYFRYSSIFFISLYVWANAQIIPETAVQNAVASSIIETSDFTHAMTYLEDDTLIVFDLDNTLIQTSQHLGSDEWFTHRLEHLTKQGLSIDKALDQVVPHWIEVQNRTEVDFVDPLIPNLLDKMQKKHVPMIGLTKRPPAMANRTLQQIAPLHINFDKTAPLKGPLVFEELNASSYQQGIIFIAQGIEKGPAITAYLKKLAKMPKKIVLIDDKMSHLQSVAKALEMMEIPFIGIRYSGADEKVKAFNPKIADIQWEHCQRILSDEQALHLLQLENHSSR